MLSLAFHSIVIIRAEIFKEKLFLSLCVRRVNIDKYGLNDRKSLQLIKRFPISPFWRSNDVNCSENCAKGQFVILFIQKICGLNEGPRYGILYFSHFAIASVISYPFPISLISWSIFFQFENLKNVTKTLVQYRKKYFSTIINIHVVIRIIWETLRDDNIVVLTRSVFWYHSSKIFVVFLSFIFRMSVNRTI